MTSALPLHRACCQFTCLRGWSPRPAHHRGHIRHNSASQASAAQELLAGAQAVAVPPPLPPPLGAAALPPPEQWNSHGDLLAGCEPGSAPLRVALLLSGGVDSSLALHLLKAAGHQVTAFYLQIWFQEDFRNTWDACPWEEDLGYCTAVCQQLGVPLEVVPLTSQYWERVVAHCLGEIRAGRTPNPDVLCNSRVKFGAFYEHLESAHAGAFDRVASGHYARLIRPTPGAADGEQADGAGGAGQAEVALALTPDAVKDQTYFLAHLSAAQLARTMFPLGHLTKAQVRALAAAAGLPNQGRKDSQGICFLGKVKFSEFVREHMGEWPGAIVEEESGAVLGYHRGFWFHTVGQRKGVPLSGGPWYVVRKDPRLNAIYVSRSYHDQPPRNAFACGAFSWNSSRRPEQGPGAPPLLCKVRHGPHAYTCTLRYDDAGETTGHVALDGNDQGLAAGQFAAFYQRGVCLGSAIILGSD